MTRRKHVNAPGSNLSHKEVLDVVIRLKKFAFQKDENYLQLVLELEKSAERETVRQHCSQMQLTLYPFFQKHLGKLDRES